MLTRVRTRLVPTHPSRALSLDICFSFDGAMARDPSMAVEYDAETATVRGECIGDWVAFLLCATVIVRLGELPSPSFEAAEGQIGRGKRRRSLALAARTPPEGVRRGTAT